MERALTILSEDLHLVPSTYITTPNYLQFQFYAFFMNSLGTRHIRSTHTYMQVNTHIKLINAVRIIWYQIFHNILSLVLPIHRC